MNFLTILLACLLMTSTLSVRLERSKRQALLGQDACLQIYSVPKQSVVCDPSPEVREGLEGLQEETARLGEDIGQISTRLDDIDPGVPKELPEEVKQRLAEIEEFKNTHSGQVEAVKRIEDRLESNSERLVNLEENSRQDLARVLEQQVRLIEVTLEKSNLTLHDQYVEQLTHTTQNLLLRLQELESDVKEQMHAADGDLRTKLDRIQESSQEELSQLKEKLEGYMSETGKRLEDELREKLAYFNLTSSNSESVVDLRTILTSIRENQAKALENRQQITQQVSVLNTDVADIQQTSADTTTKADRLQTTLELMEGRVGQLMSGQLQCENETGELMEKLARLQAIVERREHMLPRTLKIHDCQDVLQFYFPTSGVYQINLNPSTMPYEVFCELGESVGWTVIQRRQDGSIDFFNGWADYKDGFGDVQTEYWLGLQHLHTITSQREYSLRVDLEDWEGTWYYADYDKFRIEDEANNYTLRVSGYQGDAGDALSYHDGLPFSTKDRNHDNNDGMCAPIGHGAWWYGTCYDSNLNGRYYHQGDYMTTTGWGDGVVWKTLTSSNYYSVKTAIMKIKPKAPETP